MFITNDIFRSPISNLLGDSAENYWVAIELALDQPWFLVSFRQIESVGDDGAFEVGRTMLLSSVSAVEQLVRQDSGRLHRFESVQVITPGHINGSAHWKMDQLHAVWAAEEPLAAGQVAEVYETSAGVKYARSMLGTPIDELRNETLRFGLLPVPWTPT